MRNDLRPGLRKIAWRRRVAIAAVAVIGIFYGGRNLETLLGESW